MVHVWVTGSGQTGSTRLYNMIRLVMELDAVKQGKNADAVAVRKRSPVTWPEKEGALHLLEKSLWRDLWLEDRLPPDTFVVITTRDIRDTAISQTNKRCKHRKWWVDPGPRRITALLDAAHEQAEMNNGARRMYPNALEYPYEEHCVPRAIEFALSIGFHVTHSEMEEIFRELDLIHTDPNAPNKAQPKETDHLIYTRTFFDKTINTNGGDSRHKEYLSAKEQSAFATDPLLAHLMRS